MSRRFALITDYASQQIRLPIRKTAKSAGYDLAAAEEIDLAPGCVTLVPTGLKAYMEADEVLLIYIRSSLAMKQGVLLANGVGVIDADYADNPSNEGHIQIALYNPTAEVVPIGRGQTIAQGVFAQFLVVDDDQATGERRGGFGSTDHLV